MPDLPPPHPDVRASLHGVRALLLDADGVIVLRNRLIDGAAAALAALDRRGTPYRVVTNYSMLHRDTLAERFSLGGIALDPSRIITAASAAAAWTAEHAPGEPLFVLAAPDARREFAGQHLLTTDEAAAPEARVAAVVVGDAGEELTFGNLSIAFRLVRGGARFVAMHRSPWWLTAEGVTLDAGSSVAGLEYSLGQRAIVAGKPSPVVFRQGAAALAADLGVRRLPARAIAMVGDDLGADLAPARRLGMQAALVLSGKVVPGAETAAIERARFMPDAVAASLRALVEALD